MRLTLFRSDGEDIEIDVKSDEESFRGTLAECCISRSERCARVDVKFNEESVDGKSFNSLGFKDGGRHLVEFQRVRQNVPLRASRGVNPEGDKGMRRRSCL